MHDAPRARATLEASRLERAAPPAEIAWGRPARALTPARRRGRRPRIWQMRRHRAAQEPLGSEATRGHPGGPRGRRRRGPGAAPTKKWRTAGGPSHPRPSFMPAVLQAGSSPHLGGRKEACASAPGHSSPRPLELPARGWYNHPSRASDVAPWPHETDPPPREVVKVMPHPRRHRSLPGSPMQGPRQPCLRTSDSHSAMTD